MHSRKIIVQNITNLTDARYFAAWGVDYLSYNLDPASEYAITMETAMEISGWVEGPKTLIESKSIDYLDGVDGHILDESFSSLPLSKEAFFRTTLDRLQAGLTQGAYILKVDRDNLDAMKALTHEERLGHDLYMDITDLDFDLLDTLPEGGLVVQGGEEEKVGVKSFDQLDALYEWIQEDA